MSHRPFYEADLAHIHDSGFVGYAHGCAPGVIGILARARIRDGRIVDAGCGSGVLVKHLIDAGYQVSGFDLSPSMIDLAKRHVPTADLCVASLKSYRFPRCRAVIALGEVVCYLQDERSTKARLRDLFRKVFAALDAGGLWIFDVAEVGLDRGRGPAHFQRDDWTCLVRFEYDARRDRLTRQMTTFRRTGEGYRKSDERHLLQLYQSRAVTAELRGVGFRVRAVRRFGAFPTMKQRIGFIARKP
jgi:SAM-dependent methyltransferase